jgi:hypothetical protein
MLEAVAAAEPSAGADLSVRTSRRIAPETGQGAIDRDSDVPTAGAQSLKEGISINVSKDEACDAAVASSTSDPHVAPQVAVARSASDQGRARGAS